MPAGVIPASEKEIVVAINELIDLVTELKADYNAHVHGSVGTTSPVATGVPSVTVSTAIPAALPVSSVD